MSTSKLMLVGGAMDRLDDFLAAPVESVCLDLEDTVPQKLKPATRQALGDFVRRVVAAGRKPGVRINAMTTPDALDDILLLRQVAAKPSMVVLAKADTPEEVALAARLLATCVPGVHFQPIIETAAALANVEGIATVAGVGSISLGGRDLSESLRVDRSWDGLLYARSRCSAAAALGGIPIVDGPQPATDDPAMLAALCERLKSLGFSGKSAVAIEQLSIINEIWVGSPGTELEFAL